MKLKIISKLFYAITISTLIITSILTISSSLNLPLGLKVFSVMSGSMEPTIPVGSLIISQKGKYQTGDIVVYTSGTSSTTHRIINFEKKEGELLFLTKGDANNSYDSKLIPQSSVLGKVIIIVPFLGYLSSFIKTLPGFIILIVIPATLIIFSEIINLKRAVTEEIIQKKSVKRCWQKLIFFKSPIILLFIIGISLIKTNKTASYYSSSLVSIHNSVTMSSLFPQVKLYLSSDRKTVTFKVSNISVYSKLSYELTYDTDALPQGIAGQIDLTGENEITRDITLGVCTSGGTCVYHGNPHHFHLKINLWDIEGNSIFLQKSL